MTTATTTDRFNVITGEQYNTDASLICADGEHVYRVSPLEDDDSTILQEIVSRANAAPELRETLQEIQSALIEQYGDVYDRDRMYMIEIHGTTIARLVRALAKVAC